jgi:hypothetical protein
MRLRKIIKLNVIIKKNHEFTNTCDTGGKPSTWFPPGGARRAHVRNQNLSNLSV